MKMPKAQELQKKEKKVRRPKSSTAGELKETGRAAVSEAACASTEIAREEKIPPYMVFSDKTLIHMCILKPGNEAEM